MVFADTSLNDHVSQRRAKIVATLGPASNTEPVFRDLVRAGVDVVRLNFSHGTHEEKLALIQMIRKVSREEHKPLCILGDLQGPKIRTSKLKDHQPVLLKTGSRLPSRRAMSQAPQPWLAPRSRPWRRMSNKARASCFLMASSSFAFTR